MRAGGRVFNIRSCGRLHVGDAVDHDGVDHAEPLAGDALERPSVPHAPRAALVVVPAEPALGPDERIAAEYQQVLELPFAGPGGGRGVDRGAAPPVGQRQPAVAGEPVVAVEERHVDHGDERRRRPGPDAGDGEQAAVGLVVGEPGRYVGHEFS